MSKSARPAGGFDGTQVADQSSRLMKEIEQPAWQTASVRSSPAGRDVLTELETTCRIRPDSFFDHSRSNGRYIAERRH